MAPGAPISGGHRLVCGTLTASVAVGSGVAAHALGGHHAPHPVVMVLALALSLPVCTALVGARFERLRLILALLTGQAILHSLFTLLPATSATSPWPTPTGHHHLAGAVHVTGELDVVMMASHLAAAAATLGALRHGERLLQSIAGLVSLRPARTLMAPNSELLGARHVRTALIWTATSLADLWTGRGSRPVRGPPSFA